MRNGIISEIPFTDCINIPITNDDLDEGDELFIVRASSEQSNVIIGASTDVRIFDDDLAVAGKQLRP